MPANVSFLEIFALAAFGLLCVAAVGSAAVTIVRPIVRVMRGEAEGEPEAACEVCGERATRTRAVLVEHRPIVRVFAALLPIGIVVPRLRVVFPIFGRRVWCALCGAFAERALVRFLAAEDLTLGEMLRGRAARAVRFVADGLRAELEQVRTPSALAAPPKLAVSRPTDATGDVLYRSR